MSLFFFGLSSRSVFFDVRFPLIFVRQFSTKARKNCGNIGVAQVVAASWSVDLATASSAAAAQMEVPVV